MTYRDENNSLETTIRNLIKLIGDDPDREGLIETPRRILKSYNELFAGYSYTDEDIKSLFIKTFKETENYNEMIICRDIPFFSMCEHHLLPFSGVCHIGYIPKEKTIGLSKLPRLVDIFSKRLQLQERLTMQIADTIMTHLTPQGVGVIIKAEHLCVSCRGVRKTGSSMVTSAMMGCFDSYPNTKSEFVKLIGNI